MRQIITTSTITICWATIWLMVFSCAGKPQPRDDIRHDAVRKLIMAGMNGGHDSGEASVTLADRSEQLAGRYYRAHDFQPVWIDKEGRPRLDRIQALRTALHHTADEGLDPNDYIVDRPSTGCHAPTADVKPTRSSDADLARMEVSLTRTFFNAALDLLYGRIDPTTLAASTTPVLKETDLTVHFDLALKGDRFKDAFDQLAPTHTAYRRLRQALADYRRMAAAGGWPRIPDGPAIKSGDTDPRVPILVRRLKIENPHLQVDINDNRFTDGLARAVRHSQRRYGLVPDGVVGPATLAALNRSAEVRIRQIELNLERWRWLPLFFGDRYMVVNIADFRLSVEENDRQVLSMRAVVGNSYRQTPVFSAMLDRLVLNPYWFVPHRLAVEDILPVLQRDPAYLERKRITVFSQWSGSRRRIDPETIDWTKLSADEFGYVLRQDPGPANPLGRVKFILPNPHDVYIHDTPQSGQFRRFTRTFSSGCIRIEKPVDLTAYLLKDHTEWRRKRILAAIDQGAPQMVRLGRPIPVHLIYWTAFVDRNGTIQFRDDIYQRDRQLEAALMRISLARKGRCRPSFPPAHPPPD